MFGKKKYPVLTKTFCQTMESLRLAIEVFTGLRTRIMELDLNTGRGRVQLGDRETTVMFTPLAVNIMDFALSTSFPINGIHCDWVTVHFKKPDEKAKVTRLSGHDRVWRVGRSANDRWEEPF